MRHIPVFRFVTTRNLQLTAATTLCDVLNGRSKTTVADAMDDATPCQLCELLEQVVIANGLDQKRPKEDFVLHLLSALPPEMKALKR